MSSRCARKGHGIKLDWRGDYRYYFEYLSRFFLAATALAQRRLGDVRSHLFVARTAGSAGNNIVEGIPKLGLHNYKCFADAPAKLLHCRRTIPLLELAVSQLPTPTCWH